MGIVALQGPSGLYSDRLDMVPLYSLYFFDWVTPWTPSLAALEIYICRTKSC
jgi:hypothetical protein